LCIYLLSDIGVVFYSIYSLALITSNGEVIWS